MEDTLYKLDILLTQTNLWSFCQSLQQNFKRFRVYHLQNIFTPFAVRFSDQKLNSKNSGKFFIIAVDFWVLST